MVSHNLQLKVDSPGYSSWTGRNKLIINHLGRLFVTSDAATIIREIEVAHPAAKLLVMASTAQETEVSWVATMPLPQKLN